MRDESPVLSGNSRADQTIDGGRIVKRIWMEFLEIVVAWFAWKRTADISFCFLFWIILISMLARLIVPRWGIGWAMILLGVVSNAVVTLINYGIMPVVGMSNIVASSPIWRSNGQWLLLADHASMYYFSIGDFCLLFGVLTVVVQFTRERKKQMLAWMNVLKSDEGQDIAEYAVMLAVILVIVVGTIKLIGSQSNIVFSNVASSIGQ
jgi:Flp pilus assembly pilin Flp